MKTEHNIFTRSILTLLSLFITVVALGSFVFLYLDTELPNVGELKTLQLQSPIRIYTVDGKLISEFGELHRTPVTFEQIPKPLINAVLATEDQRYFEHMGVDPYGLLRATTQLILTGTKSQGGSTITMQVARNFYLTRKKTYLRKLNEIMLAMKIERQISKEKILELYLNKIYFGSRAYGVAAAAQAYFGKDLSRLNLSEMAMIAGMPKAPSALNPFVNPKAARDRRDHVLHRMLERGYITAPAYRQAIKQPLVLSPRNLAFGMDAPYVAEMVRDSLISELGDAAYKGGYSVYTTIDSRMQEAANNSLQNALLAYDRRHGYRAAQRNLGAYQAGMLDEWVNALAEQPPIHGIHSAVVIKTSEKMLTVLLDNAQIVPVSLVWNKNSISRNVFKSGDLIRVEQLNNAWQLSQLPEVEGAIVALDPKTGALKALVGGFSYAQSNFNRVTQAQRQPGSSFKPFIYAAALDKGYTLASLIEDAPIEISDPSVGIWRPQNDDHIFRGPVRLRVAIINSINLVTIRLLQNIGLSYTINYLTRFGFEKKQLPHSLSLALGTASVTPLQMASGYAVFANGGYRVTPYLIERIQDWHGKVAYEAHPKQAYTNDTAKKTDNTAQTDEELSAAILEELQKKPTEDVTKAIEGKVVEPTESMAEQAISPQIAYLMTTALQDVIKFGTGRQALALKRSDIAGKTGTTNEKVDAWFCGYNPQIVTAVWVGFDQPRSLREYGGQAALPMWIDFMRVALAGKPVQSMTPPEGIISVGIDPKSGLLAESGQSNAVNEVFQKDSKPSEVASPQEEVDKKDAEVASAKTVTPEEDSAKISSASTSVTEEEVQVEEASG
jgi:penicillin-binding protein 1A